MHDLLYLADSLLDTGLSIVFRLYDLNGSQVGSDIIGVEQPGPQYSGDIQGVPAGTYIVRVFDGAELLAQGLLEEWPGDSASPDSSESESVMYFGTYFAGFFGDYFGAQLVSAPPTPIVPITSVRRLLVVPEFESSQTFSLQAPVERFQSGEIDFLRFVWRMQLVPRFQPDRAYSVGEIIRPTRNTGYYYICSASGVTDQREPTWSTTVGESQSVGSVTFETMAYDDSRVPSISTSQWETDSAGLVLDQEELSSFHTTVRVTANESSAGAMVRNTITTSDGRTLIYETTIGE